MVMNMTNTPSNYWPLCVEYIVMVKNHMARAVLGDRTTLEKHTGQTPDVSKLLQFRWWEPVYFLNAEGVEEFGRWAGVAEHVGDELTYVVVATGTGNAVFRSDVRTASNPNAPNLQAENNAVAQLQSPNAQGTGSMDVFEVSKPIEDDERIYPYAPEDLIWKAFLREDVANGDLVRAEIVQQLKTEHDNNGRNLKFLVETTNGDKTIEHIMDYAVLCDLVEAQMEAVDKGLTTNVWTFKNILAHQGPMTAKDPRYKGSSWNILIEWDVGEPTWEPLNLIAKSDPMSVSLYGEKNGLLNRKGWKYLKWHARNTRKVYRHVREILKARGMEGPRYKYGVRLPS
jgi:hypothetical protein